MLVVDRSVWIDCFSARPAPQRGELHRLLADGHTRLVVPDLVLFEVLRGFRHERDLRQARQLMQTLDIEPACSPELAQQAAENGRSLRARGRTVRSALDVLIAAFCMANDYLLLHGDRDFGAFADLRGLRVRGH